LDGKGKNKILNTHGKPGQAEATDEVEELKQETRNR
jgi:hypothetical protein